MTASAGGPHYQTIVVEREGTVATVRINRPDKLNALNSVVRREIAQAMDQLAGDDAVRVAVLCGTASQAFPWRRRRRFAGRPTRASSASLPAPGVIMDAVGASAKDLIAPSTASA